MVDDEDDPKTAPAGNEPASQKDAETPTEPPEGEQPEGEQVETEAAAEEDILADEADDEQDDEDEGESEQEKKSRHRRKQEQLERLRAENEALRAHRAVQTPSDIEQLNYAIQARVRQKIGNPPDPYDPQFKDNYVAFSHAQQAYVLDHRQVTRQVTDEFATVVQQERERVADLVDEHRTRVAKFKKNVKDFDAVMAKATVPVAPHVERLLLQSKKSERLQYALGLKQSELVKLNRMDPESAARRIGQLEGRLSLPPQTKTQTQARKPITPLKGSGATPPSGLAAVNAYIKKQYGRV